MSKHWTPNKKTVELQSTTMATPPSRIRRDPVLPAAVETVVPDRDERDRWVVVIGVITFALALSVLAVAVASYIGWSPSQYSLTVHSAE